MKRQKKLKLKVDNLRHIHDHGLKVEFTDEQLKELVNSLKKDGVTELKAGESSLKLVTVGRVTFTKLYLAVGSHTLQAVHYLDEPAGLSFTFKREDNSDAFATLRAVILGGKLPNIWDTRTGAAQDSLRTWVKNYGWSLIGDHGLREKAIEKKKVDFQTQISVIKNKISQNERDANRFNSRTFDGEIGDARKNCISSIKHYRDLQDKSRKLLADLMKIPAVEEPKSEGVNYSSVFSAFMVRSSYSKKDDGSWFYKFSYGGSPERISHDRIEPNYTATLGEDGESVMLSSGIKCPVTLSQFVRWLKDGGSPPMTSYGAFSIIECADQDRKPRKLVKCGCHYVDPSNLSEEVKQLMTPTHQVTVIPRTPALSWPEDRDAIIEMGRNTVTQNLQAFDERIKVVISEYRTRRKQLEDLRDNKERHVLAYTQRADELNQRLLEKEAEFEKCMEPFITTTDSQSIVLSAVNALAGIKA